MRLLNGESTECAKFRSPMGTLMISATLHWMSMPMAIRTSWPAAWFSKKLSWYENPRRHDGEFHNSLWKEHVIETGFNYELMLLVDVDGDGKAQEILPNYGSSAEIAWWERVEPFSKGEWAETSSWEAFPK